MTSKTDPMTKKIDAAFKQAAKTVIDRAKQFGTPIIVYQEGKIVELDPDTMQPVKKRRDKRVG